MIFIDTPRQIGAAIRDKRKALGLTQEQLAAKAGVARSFVNRIEGGAAAAVYPDKLLAVLDAAGLRLAVVDESTDPETLAAPSSSRKPSPDDRTTRIQELASARRQQLTLDPALLELRPR